MKNILMIGAGILMVPTVKVAKSMGLHVTVVDQDPNAPAVPYADDLILASTYDYEKIIKEVNSKGWRSRFHAVFTAGADVEITVAEVAMDLGLPGLPPIVARRCNDKCLMKECLCDHGITTPMSLTVSEESEIMDALGKIGLPAVIKPFDNCGSKGVSKIDDKKNVYKAFENAKKFSLDGKIMLESFHEGTTHTVEMIAWEGEYHVASIIDTIHGYSPYFVELYHINPTRRSDDDCKKMVDLACAAAKTIGIEQGAAKVDIIFAKDGPYVMEMTARLSGGFHCQYTTPLACGTNNIKAAIQISLGCEPCMNDILPNKNECAVSKAMFPDAGVIKAIDGIEEAKKIDGIEDIIVVKNVGDKVGPYTNASDRPLYIIAHGVNEDAVWDVIKKAESTINIHTV